MYFLAQVKKKTLRDYIALILIFILTYIPSCSAQENPPLIKSPEKKEFTYEVIIDGINIPWGFCFINTNKILVTEKSGKLFLVEDSIKTEISGLPEVYVLSLIHISEPTRPY